MKALWAVAVGLLLVGLALLLRTVADPAAMLRDDPAVHWLYTADFLYPAVVWQAVADGLPARDTAFSGATFACPELLTFAAVRAVAPRPAAAVILWHAASAALAVALFVVGLRSVAPPGRRPFVAPLVLLLTAAWAGWVAVHHTHDPATFELLLPMYHGGTLVNGMGVLSLLAGRLRGGGRWRLAAAGLLTAVAVLSDRLFGPWVVGPIVLALVVTRLLVRPAAGHVLPVRWRGVGEVTVTLAAGTAGGLRLLRWLDPSDAFATYYTEPHWHTLLGRAATLAGRLGGELTSGNPLVTLAAGTVLVSLGVLLTAAVRRRAGTDRSGPVFLAAFGLAGWAAAVLAVAVSNIEPDRLGTVPWADVSRYLLGPTAVGGFAWAVWLAGPRRAWLLVALAAVAVGWAGQVPRSPTLDLLRYRPGYVERLDAGCGDRGLTHGLGGYWLARPAAVLSQSGVRVDQVALDPTAPAGLAAHPWLSNPAGYGLGYGFLLAHDAGGDAWYRPTVAAVVGRLGEPRERVPLGGCALLVYDRPGDAGVRDFATTDPTLAVRRWRRGADTLTLPGWSLRPPRPDGELVACGPYLRLPPGRYRADFRVQAAAGDRPAGWVDVFLDEPTGGATERFLAQTVPGGFGGELGGEFAVRKRGPRWVVFRAASDGNRLVLREVRLVRLASR